MIGQHNVIVDERSRWDASSPCGTRHSWESLHFLSRLSGRGGRLGRKAPGSYGPASVPGNRVTSVTPWPRADIGRYPAAASDAAAICEAVTRPSMRFVGVRPLENQAVHGLTGCGAT